MLHGLGDCTPELNCGCIGAGDGDRPVSAKWRKGRALICKDCDSIVSESGVLRAESPFNPEDELTGCPTCKAADQFRLACAASGCTFEVSMGMRHEDGVYRSTCSKHGPEFLR